MADDSGLYNVKLTTKRKPTFTRSEWAADVARRTGRIYYEAVRAELAQNMAGRVLQRRTGNLYRSWTGRPTVVANKYVYIYKIGSDSPYARIHEYGGEIKAKNNPHKYLRFQLPDGNWVQVERVVIPARRYVSGAIANVQARGSELMFRALAEVKQNLKGSAP